jgi:hypothetical protein
MITSTTPRVDEEALKLPDDEPCLEILEHQVELSPDMYSFSVLYILDG